MPLISQARRKEVLRLKEVDAKYAARDKNINEASLSTFSSQFRRDSAIVSITVKAVTRLSSVLLLNRGPLAGDRGPLPRAQAARSSRLLSFLLI